MKQSERIVKDFNLQDCKNMLLNTSVYDVRIVPEGQIEPLLKFLTLTIPDTYTHPTSDGELFYALIDRRTDTTDTLVFRRSAYSSDHESDNIDQQACLIDMQILRNNFDGEHDEHK